MNFLRRKKLKEIDFEKMFDSMKKNDISEVIIKNGKDVFEFRRGGYKQVAAPVAAAPAIAVAAPAAVSAVPTVAVAAETVAESAPAASAAPSVAAPSNLYEVKSPLVGTYYASSKPGAPAFVEVGVKVTKGQKLCIVEAMKNFNEIESEVNGVVREVLLKDGDLVEYGKVLFRIEKE